MFQLCTCPFSYQNRYRDMRVTARKYCFGCISMSASEAPPSTNFHWQIWGLALQNWKYSGLHRACLRCKGAETARACMLGSCCRQYLRVETTCVSAAQVPALCPGCGVVTALKVSRGTKMFLLSFLEGDSSVTNNNYTFL